MNNIKDIFPLLIEATPSFKTHWDKFIQEYKEDESYPYYLCMSDFNRHIIKLLKEKELNQLKKTFKVIEHILIEFDHDSQELITVGLLEGIQNQVESKKVKREEVESLLQPETEFWWNKVYRFWENGKLLNDERQTN